MWAWLNPSSWAKYLSLLLRLTLRSNNNNLFTVDEAGSSPTFVKRLNAEESNIPAPTLPEELFDIEPALHVCPVKRNPLPASPCKPIRMFTASTFSHTSVMSPIKKDLPVILPQAEGTRSSGFLKS